MKKLFIALAAVALTACVKVSEKTVNIYAWQGEGGNSTEQTDEQWKAFDKAIHQPYTVKP